MMKSIRHDRQSKCNVSRVLAIVETSVCLLIILRSHIKTMQAKITKSLPGLPQGLWFLSQNFVPLGEEVPVGDVTEIN